MTFELGQGTGPLQGIKVVEIAGIGPGPHAATILADLGADVIRVERPGGAFTGTGREHDFLTRGRPSVALDLKDPSAVEAVLQLVDQADVLLEGMRPGVTERMGLGPDACLERNPGLVYGRMTGWGQTGPLAHAAGHDMNYIAITGTLHASGQDADRPHFAQNVVGDFGGGSTYLVIGVLAALMERGRSGCGQVVDAAIVDGTAHLNMMWAAMLAGGVATERRGVNPLDGGLPNYALYETSDGGHLSVGPIEPQFYAELMRLLGLDLALAADPAAARTAIGDAIRTRTLVEWTSVFDGTDACVAPVLPLREAARHPHMAAREVFVERDGGLQPAPAPRFSRTVPTLTTGPTHPGAQTREALEAWGVAGVDKLLVSGAAVQA
ncbi:CoA transferase [Nocardioides phosphati]|uniref:CoA transferase n=1 Tax=Nocardioides phosphati TaxID=1867775 RepID=A0ABQ2NFC8_9ACTN|nr:CaiB/BaiF CoA-transferase family protein [Nocardioides phosphati]GGO93967.1 CoA transferase [Nocardioides phosphati]